MREPDLATVAPLFTGGTIQGNLHAVAFDAPPDAVDNIKAGYADFVLNQTFITITQNQAYLQPLSKCQYLP